MYCLGSAKDDEGLANFDALACSYIESLDRASLISSDLVLHLHSFEDEKNIAGFYSLALGSNELHDFARHWSIDGFFTSACTRSVMPRP